MIKYPYYKVEKESDGWYTVRYCVSDNTYDRAIQFCLTKWGVKRAIKKHQKEIKYGKQTYYVGVNNE